MLNNSDLEISSKLLPSAIKSSTSSNFSKSISTDNSFTNFFSTSLMASSYFTSFSLAILIILYILKPNFVFIGPKTSFKLALKILSALSTGSSDFSSRPILVSFIDKSKYFFARSLKSLPLSIKFINFVAFS